MRGYLHTPNGGPTRAEEAEDGSTEKPMMLSQDCEMGE